MGYMHINNLYKDSRIFDFKEGYAMEKIHGTSARIEWKDNAIKFFSGGCKHETFVNIFNTTELHNKFMKEFEDVNVIVYGEQYGGKQQGMSETYGKEPMFIAFEVQIGEAWLNVPNAEGVANKLNLEFVPYVKIPATLEAMNIERDAPSVVAKRRGIKEIKPREGIVIRPIEEYFDKRGNRVITKHKRDEFMETKTPRKVDPKRLKILDEANKIAEEWVTPMRFKHVLDKFKEEQIIENTSKFIKAMNEDVLRESEGEIVISKEAIKAIGKEGAKLYRKHIQGEISKK